ncbi:MAG: ATP-binding cassette domain-containing protein [Raineya sp.]|jgi:ABC-type multidrug transport system ATPase subunit|nr:ATP-binding cassette domain-containing protein [Raineya sp.]
MSEEVLDALTKVFAITTLQDGGTSSKEQSFVEEYFQEVLAQDAIAGYIAKYKEYYEKLWADFGVRVAENEKEIQPGEEEGAPKKITDEERAFQKFSVKLGGLFRKEIAPEKESKLVLSQKILILVRMLELLASDNRITKRRLEVVETSAEYLVKDKKLYKATSDFVFKSAHELVGQENILTVSSVYIPRTDTIKHIQVERLDGEMIFLQLPDANMYFVKYTGNENIKLNDFLMKPNKIYQFTSGSIIRTQAGNAFYFSDIIANFTSGQQRQKLSFNAVDIEYKFKNGNLGLRGVTVAEGAGNLIGIMGASGAGKTTLLNVLAGLEKPSRGQVLLNGIDIHSGTGEAQGVIGYVAQDDLLIEELSVYQNLYYNTKLCFKSFSEQVLDERVMKTLEDLGLAHIKDLKVGNVLNKTISGGQRKRLNIALELIREPAVMFLDEPTSGLSSKDSENVLDLLKELSAKGKLIFVVIHQPSSDIFKMFNKLIILDTGGYQAFYGNPVDAVMYFKKQDNQLKADEGQCPSCGNVNPEQIFDIIEARTIDEHGKYTNQRKKTPIQWNELFNKNFSDKVRPVEEQKEKPPKALDLPNWIKQTVIFTVRDFLAKAGNRQYVAINLLEAPLLAFLLAFIIRFENDPLTRGYTYRYNDNMPAYILICVLVALFMGLTVSAEEIIKDRKIQRRESFLNLSRHSYLFSKLIILFTLSAIQTLSFVIIGNAILEIKAMNMMYWFVLFTVSCFANILGLNISATFNSVVTIYITIPLLLIPQMILSGVIFNFDKLNQLVSDRGQVPILADLMVSRWGFEAIAVEQYKNNLYQKPYFEYEKEESIADYRRNFWVDAMRNTLTKTNNILNNQSDSAKRIVKSNLELLSNEVRRERLIDAQTAYSKSNRPKLYQYANIAADLTPGRYTPEIGEKLKGYLDSVSNYYRDRFTFANKLKNSDQEYKEQTVKGYRLDVYKNKYFNESLSDLVRNANIRDKVLEYRGGFLQQIDPIFQDPLLPANALDYRTQFLAPNKHLFGMRFGTYYFNITVMWVMSIILYFTLYYETFKKAFNISLTSLLPKKNNKSKVKK